MAKQKKPLYSRDDNPKLHADLMKLQGSLLNNLQQFRKNLGLPELIIPDFDTELDKKLHASLLKCPFCGGDDITASPFTSDQPREAVCSVRCNDSNCDHEWFERFCFVGGWEDD